MNITVAISNTSLSGDVGVRAACGFGTRCSPCVAADSTGGARGAPPARASAAEWPQQRAGDDVPLDLAGAFPDALDARIPPDPLERQVGHEAHTAVDLQRLVGDHRQRL